MKKNSSIFPVISTLLLSMVMLGGCINLGGESSGATKTADERSKLYDTTAYSITIPKDWEVIEKDDLTSDVPPETVIVFRNNVKNETYTANVNIVLNKLQEPLTTLEYAKRVANRQSSGLINFKESKKDHIKITIGDSQTETFYTLFEAKKTQDAKNIRYLQTYAVKGEDAYIVTGSVSPQENENMVQTVEEIVKSFKLK
jgi:hypothetical protein